LISRKEPTEPLFEHLTSYLSKKVNAGVEEEPDRADTLELIFKEILFINKSAAMRAAQEKQTSTVLGSLGKTPEAELDAQTSCVRTPYLSEQTSAILSKIEREPFGHCAIYGPSGSGKMTLVKLLSSLSHGDESCKDGSS
jgi:ABC-type multidrug transport system fused ATPase/permease subunit